jgi:hypothetical protein
VAPGIHDSNRFLFAIVLTNAQSRLRCCRRPPRRQLDRPSSRPRYEIRSEETKCETERVWRKTKTITRPGSKDTPRSMPTVGPWRCGKDFVIATRIGNLYSSDNNCSGNCSAFMQLSKRSKMTVNVFGGKLFQQMII